MKYLVTETNCGELWDDIALFNDINDAVKFIESCAWATDIHQQLENPVISIVGDNYYFSEYSKKDFEKRFRKPWRIF